VLKSLDKNGQARIYQIKNKDGEVKYESDEIVNIIEEYYKD